MQCVTVLVQDDLRVLRVVDAALAKAQLELRVIRREAVVVAELVQANELWSVVDARVGRAKPQ